MPDKKWSFFENGMPGLHLTINPQKPVAEAPVGEQFRSHGITLTSKELQAIMAGRAAGIASVKNLLDKVLPGFAPDSRLSYSTQITDALLNKSLSAQLSQEAPNTLDELQQRDEAVNAMFRRLPPPGSVRSAPPTLLQQVPVGFSVTVYW